MGNPAALSVGFFVRAFSRCPLDKIEIRLIYCFYSREQNPFQGEIQMYIFQNALKNIIRNRGRNILMAAIILAIIVTTVTSLMINNTAEGIIDDYKTRFGSEVTIAPIPGAVRASGGGMPMITDEMTLAFSESQYIKETIFTAYMGCFSNTLQPVDASRSPSPSGSGGGNAGTGGEIYVQQTMRLTNNFGDDFKNGMRDVADGGAMPQGINECIVSVDFAELNNISVGDTIELSCNVFINYNLDVRYGTYTLLVTGIYYDLTDEYNGMNAPTIPTFLNRRNEILASYETIMGVLQNGELGVSIDAKYYLKEPSMLDAYDAELREKGLSPIYGVSVDEEGYQKVVGPVEGLRSLSNTFMVIVLILGGVILILISSIAIRERKYEIGVLRAMGMKKHKVALGLWSEMLVITAVCLVLGIGVGTLISQPVTDLLLAQQIESAQSASQNYYGGYISSASSSGGSNLTALDELDVSLGMDTIIEISAIAFLLATLAGLAAISKITKYEPIKILAERA